MINVLVNGALGRMGSLVVNKVEEAGDMALFAAVDPFSEGGAVLKDLADVAGVPDVVIDFSNHTLTPALLEWCTSHKTPLVLGTTGHTDGERAAVGGAAQEIPLFFSANMSMGIALLADLAKRAAALFPDADVEIVEAHHNQKRDAPSGTALMLARAVQEVRPDAVVNDIRSGIGKREKNEIGVQSVRMGNLPGTHVVCISTGAETLTLKHETHDRALFAEGALAAARFLLGKRPGMYGMDDLLAK